jgi:hypothetical protein
MPTQRPWAARLRTQSGLDPFDPFGRAGFIPGAALFELPVLYPHAAPAGGEFSDLPHIRGFHAPASACRSNGCRGFAIDPTERFLVACSEKSEMISVLLIRRAERYACCASARTRASLDRGRQHRLEVNVVFDACRNGYSRRLRTPRLQVTAPQAVAARCRRAFCLLRAWVNAGSEVSIWERRTTRIGYCRCSRKIGWSSARGQSIVGVSDETKY